MLDFIAFLLASLICAWGFARVMTSEYNRQSFALALGFLLGGYWSFRFFL